MRVFLTGFMGAGKTTTGRRLADKLGLEFRDLDLEIERIAGMTIGDIFRIHGEYEFRKKESEALRDLVRYHDHLLIATGGGTPCFHDNMMFMNDSGITVYLELPTGALVHRLIHSKSRRPLVEGMDEMELQSYVTDTLAQRAPFFRESKIIADGMNVNVNDLAERIRSFYEINSGKTLSICQTPRSHAPAWLWRGSSRQNLHLPEIACDHGLQVTLYGSSSCQYPAGLSLSI